MIDEIINDPDVDFKGVRNVLFIKTDKAIENLSGLVSAYEELAKVIESINDSLEKLGKMRIAIDFESSNPDKKI